MQKSMLSGEHLLIKPELFSKIADTARLTPQRVAIISNGKKTTYDSLEVESNLLAATLEKHSLGEGDIIGIMIERGADVVISILAIWKIGAAYLPLDPNYPEERLGYMLTDSQAVCILSKTSINLDLPPTVLRLNIDDASEHNLPASPSLSRQITPSSSERAYVIYTSGSTGQPKGIENTHGALSNFLQSMILTPGLTRDDALLSVTTMSFDISILEFFVPLLVGARLVIATEEEGIDGFDLIDLIEEYEITLMQGTPSTWRMITSCNWKGNSKLRALCGGETLPLSLAKELFEKTAELWNMYGPTETTVWSSCERLDSPQDISIGAPIHNTDIYILDQDMNVVPRGMQGDLWIGGKGVAKGYLNRPDLTDEKFKENPFEDKKNHSEVSRIYMTGDLAILRNDGKLQLNGRKDSQLKIRGYRIEAEEIEEALERYPDIREAAVALHYTEEQDPLLVGYFIKENNVEILQSELRQFLRKSIPDYMIPQAFMELTTLPLTNNNKIDRNRLPQPDSTESIQAHVIHPRTDREAQIAAVWREILGIEDISITDNFFDLGGQSLQVVKMAALLNERFGFRLSPRAVIYETLEQLAISSLSSPE